MRNTILIMRLPAFLVLAGLSIASCGGQSTVYVNPAEAVYHSRNCPELSPSATAYGTEGLWGQGYSPCPKCMGRHVAKYEEYKARRRNAEAQETAEQQQNHRRDIERQQRAAAAQMRTMVTPAKTNQLTPGLTRTQVKEIMQFPGQQVKSVVQEQVESMNERLDGLVIVADVDFEANSWWLWKGSAGYTLAALFEDGRLTQYKVLQPGQQFVLPQRPSSPQKGRPQSLSNRRSLSSRRGR